MNQLVSLTDNDRTVRTQITLTKKLKQLVEERARLTNRSLSEYLRQAAWLSLLLEEQKTEELDKVANQAIGSVDLNKHPEWQTIPKIKNWLKKIRREWK